MTIGPDCKNMTKEVFHMIGERFDCYEKNKELRRANNIS